MLMLVGLLTIGPFRHGLTALTKRKRFHCRNDGEPPQTHQQPLQKQRLDAPRGILEPPFFSAIRAEHSARHFEVIDAECVGCNLCVNVCPVENCITMEPLPAGMVDRRTGQAVDAEYGNWTTHPNNPTRVAAE